MLGLPLRLLRGRGAAFHVSAAIVLVLCAGLGVLLCASQGIVERVEGVLGRQRGSEYDILVLPAGADAAPETSLSLVSPQHLSGIAGGIDAAQLEAIRSVPGVELAAPIAMLGYYHETLRVETGLDPGPGAYAVRCGYEGALGAERQEWLTYHVLGDERDAAGPTDTEAPGALASASLPDCHFDYWALLGAIDPETEAALLGLDEVVQGTYFGPDSPVACEPGRAGARVLGPCTIPALFSASSYQSGTLSGEVLHLALPEGVESPAYLPDRGRSYLETLPVESTPYSTTVEVGAAYQDLLRRLAAAPSARSRRLQFSTWLLPSPVRYREHTPLGEGLPTPVLEVVAPSDVVEQPTPPYAIRPLPAPLRELRSTPLPRPFTVSIVGAFDVGALLWPREFPTIPMDVYAPPEAVHRLDAHGEPVAPAPVRPALSPLGFLQVPPTMLTTLEAAAAVFGDGTISAVRVRVAGIDAISTEAFSRLDAVAADIRQRTGLEAVVVAGSSPREVMVRIPSVGEGAAERGYLLDTWLERGVGRLIVQDVERAHARLSRLALLGMGLLLAQIVVGLLAGRRDRFGLLRALGWRPRSVLSLALTQGLLAGAGLAAAGTVLAWVAALNLDLPLLPERLEWSLLVVVATVTLGAVLPAARALRSPGSRRTAPRRRARAGRRVGGWLRRRARGLWSRRGMTALTMGVAGSVTALLTVLRGGLWVFGDSLRATPLGRLLAGASGGLERTVADTATLLGVLAVAVALLVTLSGRRQEIGLLRAFGWRTVAVLRATALESAILALGGGVAGSHLAATLAAAVGSVAQTDAAYAAQQALLAPVLATILAAIYPVVLVTRVPPLQAMGRTP